MRSIQYITVLITASLLIFTTSLFAQQNNVVTFVTSINTGTANTIYWDIDGQTEFHHWDNDYVRIVINIESSNVNRQTHKLLAMNGFYKPIVEFNENRDVVSLRMKADTASAYRNNKLLESNLSFIVYAPRFVEFQQRELLAENE